MSLLNDRMVTLNLMFSFLIYISRGLISLVLCIMLHVQALFFFLYLISTQLTLPTDHNSYHSPSLLTDHYFTLILPGRVCSRTCLAWLLQLLRIIPAPALDICSRSLPYSMLPYPILSYTFHLSFLLSCLTRTRHMSLHSTPLLLHCLPHRSMSRWYNVTARYLPSSQLRKCYSIRSPHAALYCTTLLCVLWGTI